MKVPFYKKLASYFYPIRMKKLSGEKNNYLELSLYRGQIQLSTKDALYSDGHRYTPMTIAFKELNKQNVKAIISVLALGGGIGSVVQVTERSGYHPIYTIVEHDNAIINLAKEVLSGEGKRINFVCDDAQNYIETNHEKYDLLVVDIFDGRVVKDFVTHSSFLKKCHQSINPGGNIIINYIVSSLSKWEADKDIIQSVFPKNTILSHGINRVIVAKA